MGRQMGTRGLRLGEPAFAEGHLLPWGPWPCLLSLNAQLSDPTMNSRSGRANSSSTHWGGASPPPPGLSPLVLKVTLIMWWERNSKGWRGLNIGSQATCRNAPLNLLKSRGWRVPLGTTLCFRITPARLSLVGPRSLL